MLQVNQKLDPTEFFCRRWRQNILSIVGAPINFGHGLPGSGYCIFLDIIFVALLLSLALNCSSSKSTRVSEENIKSAMTFFYVAENDIIKGDFNSALKNIDSAIICQPSFANLYRIKGWVLEKLNRPDSAIRAYERGLNYQSSQPQSMSRISKLYFDAGNYERSSFYLKRLNQQYPDSIESNLKLAISYYMEKKYPLALDYLRTYIKLVDAPSISYWKWLGLTHYRTKKYHKAVAALQKYVDKSQNDPVGLKFLGIVKFQLKEYDQAISFLNAAEKNLNNDPEIYLYRARYFAVVNKPNIALDQLNIALSYDSTNVDILFELALYSFQKEKFQKSKDYFKTVVKLKPDFWLVYRYLGLLAERDGLKVKAKQYYQLYLNNIFVLDQEIKKRLEELSNSSHEN